MYYVGVDLHKRTLVVATEDDSGAREKPVSFSCRDSESIRTHFEGRVPFKAVIEASSSYRWLYDMLSDLGEVILAHPLRLRAIVSGRAKTGADSQRDRAISVRSSDTRSRPLGRPGIGH